MKKHNSDLYPIGFNKPSKPTPSWKYWVVAAGVIALWYLIYSYLN